MVDTDIETVPIKGRKNSSNSFDKESEILAHQLEGVMFHFDATLFYTLVGDRNMCRIHYRQFVEEMKTHIHTSKDMIKRYGRIIEPSSVERIEVYNSIPADHEEITKMKHEVLEKWFEWENETEALYSSISTVQPHAKIWTKLLKDVKMEIKEIHLIMKKEGLEK